jgi:glyoxylase-like metal-dependent hydrolase (beta-lactamase superfamily II)
LIDAGTVSDLDEFGNVAGNANVPNDIVDNCYLIKHAQGYFLWDTGVADSTPTDTPNSADPKALTWRRPKTLAAQLDELGVKPDDIKYLAVSHTHPITLAMSKSSRRRCFSCRRPSTNGRMPTASRALIQRIR